MCLISCTRHVSYENQKNMQRFCWSNIFCAVPCSVIHRSWPANSILAQKGRAVNIKYVSEIKCSAGCTIVMHLGCNTRPLSSNFLALPSLPGKKFLEAYTVHNRRPLKDGSISACVKYMPGMLQLPYYCKSLKGTVPHRFWLIQPIWGLNKWLIFLLISYSTVSRKYFTLQLSSL